MSSACFPSKAKTPSPEKGRRILAAPKLGRQKATKKTTDGSARQLLFKQEGIADETKQSTRTEDVDMTGVKQKESDPEPMTRNTESPTLAQRGLAHKRLRLLHDAFANWWKCVIARRNADLRQQMRAATHHSKRMKRNAFAGFRIIFREKKRREHDEFIAWQDSFATSGDDSSDGEGSAESNDIESDFKRKMALCLTSAK